MDQTSKKAIEPQAPMPALNSPTDLTGLVTAVQSKMSELMAWHSQKTSQLEADRAEFDEQARQQRDELSAERKALGAQREEIKGQRGRLEQDRATLAEQMEGLDRKRAKLLELAQKLEAEQDALGREWTAVHHARELNEKLADELDRQRDKVGERVSTWLSQTAASLDQPLKLTEGESRKPAIDAFDELEAFEAEVSDEPEQKAKPSKKAA